MTFVPRNEAGVVASFAQLSERLGYSIISIGIRYPDALIFNAKTNSNMRCEFEFLAHNFLEHGHDPENCDLIVCWIDDYPNAPLPVLELSTVHIESNLPDETAMALRDAELLIRQLRGLLSKRTGEVHLLTEALSGATKSAIDELGGTRAALEGAVAKKAKKLVDKAELRFIERITSGDGAAFTGPGQHLACRLCGAIEFTGSPAHKRGARKVLCLTCTACGAERKWY